MMLIRKLGYVASRGVGDIDAPEDADIDQHDSKTMGKFDYEAEEMYQLIGQVNKFGLGYSGMQHEFEDVRSRNSKSAVNFGHTGKTGITGTAFGVGVDEEEEDLEDFFSGDSMAKYNYEIVEDDERENHFGWTAPKPMQSPSFIDDSSTDITTTDPCSRHCTAGIDCRLPAAPDRDEQRPSRLRAAETAEILHAGLPGASRRRYRSAGSR